MVSCDKCAQTSLQLFHDGGLYHIETSTLIYIENQWTSFYMIGTSVMRDKGFAIRLFVPSRKTHQMHQIFGKKTKCSITIYAFSLSYQLSDICSTCYYYLHRSLVYPLFIQILYDECSRHVRGECSSAKYTLRN